MRLTLTAVVLLNALLGGSGWNDFTGRCQVSALVDLGARLTLEDVTSYGSSVWPIEPHLGKVPSM